MTLRFIKEIIAYTKKYRCRFLVCAFFNIIGSMLSVTQPVLMLNIFDAGIQISSLRNVVLYTCGFIAIVISSTIIEGYASKQSTLWEKSLL